MLPAERRHVRDNRRCNIDALLLEFNKRRLQIACVPQNDRGNQQIQTGSTVNLALEAPIAHFTKPVEEDRSSECIACFDQHWLAVSNRRS